MSKRFYSVLIFLSFGITSFSQNQIRIDSLKKELKKFDSHKTEMGINKATLADTFKVQILERLWSNYLHFDNKTSIGYALEMIALSKKIGFKKGEADGYVRLGISNDESSNYEAAIQNSKQAILIQEEIKDTIGLASSYINLGVIFSKTSNFQEALKYLELAAKYTQLLKDDYGYAVALSDIGIVYKLQMKYPEALQYYEKAKGVFEKEKEIDGVIACSNNIGNIYIFQNKLQAAIAIFKKSELNKDQSNYLKADTYNSLSKAYLLKNEPDAALNYVNKALEIQEQMESKYGMALSYIQLGEIYKKKQQVKSAIKFAKSGLTIADEIGEIEFSKNAHQLLAELYQMESNFKEAFYHQVLFKNLNDSIFNNEKDKKFTELKMTLHFEKLQDSLVAEHNKAVAIKELEISQQNKERNYSIIAMTFIIALLIITIYQRNKLGAVKRQQALQEERKRIGQDLHDDLGTGLTSIIMMSEQIKLGNTNELLERNIDKIKNASKLMVEQMADIVWAMNSDNDSLESLIRYLQNYVYSFYEDQNINLQTDFPEHIIEVKLNGLMRRNIFLLVKETLNNACKYAEALNVFFRVTINGHEVMIAIKDDGKGFDLNNIKRFGNGLKNIKSRMDAIGGTYSIASKPGEGTYTVIKFFLIRNRNN